MIESKHLFYLAKDISSTRGGFEDTIMLEADSWGYQLVPEANAPARRVDSVDRLALKDLHAALS